MSSRLAQFRTRIVNPRRRLLRLRTTTSIAVRRQDSLLVLLGTAFLYLIGYLFVTGDLSLASTGWSMSVVPDPLARAFEPGPGAFRFEPIAIVDASVIRLLVSPINGLIAGVLAGLVGWNFALSYLALAQPRACSCTDNNSILSNSTGVLACVPALLSGAACCAPLLLLILGIQAGGALLTAITWLLPAGILALIGSLLYLAGRVDPISAGAAERCLV